MRGRRRRIRDDVEAAWREPSGECLSDNVPLSLCERQVRFECWRPVLVDMRGKKPLAEREEYIHQDRHSQALTGRLAPLRFNG